MKIVVLAKQTLTTEARIELDPDGRIVVEKIKKIINPYDEFAIEEAVQLKEKNLCESVVVLTLGNAEAEEASRQALAMGADTAIRIDDTGMPEGDAMLTAEVLATALRRIPFDLLLAGYVAVDDNSAQVAVRVAEILNLPQINVVSRMEFANDQLTAWREADGYTEVLSVSLPVLVTADKSLNKPRYPTLPNIMKAKKKPIEVLKWNELVSVHEALVRILKYTLPPPRSRVKTFSGALEETARGLVQALRNEAKVI